MADARPCETVIIVGAGPVGLLLACELGVRGVPVMVVDEKPGLVLHPKANTQNARTMEIYRRLGIAHRLRHVGLPPDRATDVAYFTQLFGRELHRVSLPSPREAEAAVLAGDPRWPTPEPQHRVTQMEVEPVLLARARQFPSVEVRFGLSVTAITQNEDGVAVTIAQVDGGPAQELRAGYLVGCDGGRSIVRRELGLRFAGEDALQMDFLGGRMLATYFRAPTLLERFPHPDTWMHWVMQPSGRAILLVIDPARYEFLVHVQLAPDLKDQDIHFSARLASILGESVPHEIISQAEWRAGVGLVADRYGVGRCFLAGDAVHLFTPTGGFGLNTGIEDSFNLGWKLAAVCHGIAPPTLLGTYQSERRPIAVRNVAYALELAKRNGQCPVSPALDADTQEGAAARAATAAHLASFARWEFDTPGIQLGARYDGSPIIIGGGSSPPADSPIDYIPSGVPGGRLPHVWLRDGAALFDRLGRDFTLILLDGTADAPHWSRAADALGLDLSILQLVGEAALMSLIAAPAVLIRPDQHIAWRGRIDVDPAGILNRVTGADIIPAEIDALAVG